MKQYVDRPSSEPAAWTQGHRVQACRSGESAIAAEALMNNAGYDRNVWWVRDLSCDGWRIYLVWEIRRVCCQRCGMAR